VAVLVVAGYVIRVGLGGRCPSESRTGSRARRAGSGVFGAARTKPPTPRNNRASRGWNWSWSWNWSTRREWGGVRGVGG